MNEQHTFIQILARRWSSYLLVITHLLILFLFFSGSWWWRPRWVFAETTPAFIREAMLQGAGSDAYTAVSFARFAHTPLIIMIFSLWVLMGFRGLRQLVLSGRWYWVLSFGLAIFWIVLSIGWSVENSFAAQNQASQWFLVFLLVLVISCVGPSTRMVSLAILGGAVFQALLGIVQTLLQHEVGIHLVDDRVFRIGIGIYEFDLNPELSGANVIQSNGMRFLRAQGLTPHPNLLAPVLVLGVLSSFWLWQHASKSRAMVIVMHVIMLWGLFLTFSRASIGGLVLGTMLLGISSLTTKQINRHEWRAFLVLLGFLAGLFYIFYQPLVNVRVGIGDEGQSSIEPISVVSRQIYLQQAQKIINAHTFSGIGIGNFPYASQRLLQQRPDLRIRGDNVHRVYYLAVAEIGLVGSGLFAITALVVIGFLLRNYRHMPLSAWGILVGIVAWLAIGWFEFFWWALMPYQILFWGCIAALMYDVLPNTEDDPLATSS